MQSFCSSFHLPNLIHNHGLILFKSLKDSMTKKSLSNDWVVNLKDSYLFQTFSFEIFTFGKSLSRNLATELIPLKSWKVVTASKNKHIQSIGKQISIFKEISNFIIITFNDLLQLTTLENPTMKSLLVTSLNLVERLLLTKLCFQGSLKSLMLFQVTMFLEKIIFLISRIKFLPAIQVLLQ